MKDAFVSARLVSSDTIRLTIVSQASYERPKVSLLVDSVASYPLLPSRYSSTAGFLVVDFRLENPLALGHSYVLAIPSFGLIPLDVSEATTFSGFDSEFFYAGDDLGAFYDKTMTRWALWAPLASSVVLCLRKIGDSMWRREKMTREEKGVFRLTLKGDYCGYEYLYSVTNSEITLETADPYAKASMPNGVSSVVEDFSLLKRELKRQSFPPMPSYGDAIIYEGNVRDLTVDKHSNIEHKGTYEGLYESNRKTKDGNPAGIDYLSSLGITHLQLQPIYDFKTIDELQPLSQYNWGYDPSQYFVPEGSYATHVQDPLNRIQEVQNLVEALHRRGIRLVMDVVFNHVYDYLSSSFEKTVPNYWFRHLQNGEMSNASNCGNDVASERPMVQKFILDVAKWWIDFYEVDGFRFDLMGLIDAKTLSEILAYGRSKDPSFIVYGEGWDMGTKIASPLGTISNASLLPDFAFFNDKFRDAMKEYVFGDINARDKAKYAFLGSVLEYGASKPRFLTAAQSVNYVECHDDMTFFDSLVTANPALSFDERMALVRLSLALVILSYGIPFLHEGEEIGASKYGKSNTYNLPDVYNKFSYRLLDERIAMYDYVRKLISFRKSHGFIRNVNPSLIANNVNFEDLNESAFVIRFSDQKQLAPYQEICFFVNPSSKSLTYHFSSDRILLIDGMGDVEESQTKVQDVLIPKYSFLATCLRQKP